MSCCPRLNILMMRRVGWRPSLMPATKVRQRPASSMLQRSTLVSRRLLPPATVDRSTTRRPLLRRATQLCRAMLRGATLRITRPPLLLRQLPRAQDGARLGSRRCPAPPRQSPARTSATPNVTSPPCRTPAPGQRRTPDRRNRQTSRPDSNRRPGLATSAGANALRTAGSRAQPAQRPSRWPRR